MDVDEPNPSPAEEDFVDSFAREFLDTEPGRCSDALELASALRARLSGPQARLVAERLDSWRRAVGKFEHPTRLRLTRLGLEQATPFRVARQRAARFQNLDGVVLDATAGLGGDALQLAQAGLEVIALEREPRRARYLAHNLASCGGRGWAVRGSAERPPVKRFAGVVIDPDRRVGGRRSLDPRHAEPGWDVVQALARRASALACVKLAPGFDPGALATMPPGPSLWSWVSLDGELKELALWTGPAAAAFLGPREAVALRGTDVHRRAGAPGAPSVLAEPQRAHWLAEVDPALVRASLVASLADETGLGAITDDGGYLGGAAEPRSPWLTALRVVDSAPFDTKHVRRLLARHDIGPLTVKKRGFPTSADELVRRWRGKGANPGTLLVARHRAGHRVWLVER